jgi:hypothetical protein
LNVVEIDWVVIVEFGEVDIVDVEVVVEVVLSISI